MAAEEVEAEAAEVAAAIVFSEWNNHIAIDRGACFSGGRLAAICLDTGEEFCSSVND